MPRNCQKVGSEASLHTSSRRGQQATILRGDPRDLPERNKVDSQLCACSAGYSTCTTNIAELRVQTKRRRATSFVAIPLDGKEIKSKKVK